MGGVTSATPSPTPTPGLVTIPTGVFYLPSGQSWEPQLNTNPGIVGAVIGATWGDLNPVEGGAFAFDAIPSGGGQSFNALLAAAEAAPYITSIRIGIACGGAGIDPCHGTTPCAITRGGKPQWLEDKIVAKGNPIIYFPDPPDMPFTGPMKGFISPWDPDLIAAYSVLYQAVAARVAGHPKVKIVQWQYLNYSSNDWNPGSVDTGVDGIPPGQSSPATRWMDSVHHYYTPTTTFQTALTDAGKQTVTVCHAAFPNLALVSAIGQLKQTPDMSGTNGTIPIAVMEWAHDQWPGHIVVTKQSLNANIPQSSAPSGGPWDDYHTLQVYGLSGAAQAVWKCVQDCSPGSNGYQDGDDWAGSRMHGQQKCGDAVQSFVDTTDVIETYNVAWVEYYEADLLHLDSKPHLDFSPTTDPHIPAGYPSDAVAYAASVLNH